MTELPQEGTGRGSEGAPEISAVVVHWRDEEHLRELVVAWPADPRFELLVVDNSGTLGSLPAPATLLDPGRNLGFAGGVNRGAAAARAPWLLILNPDARPLPGAVERLAATAAEAEGGSVFAGAAGVVPALVGEDGSPQCRWQLQPLPSPWTLLRQAFFLAGARGPAAEPAAGTPVAQPAAAALLLRRSVLRDLGGLDDGYYPAWFEDVDLARRLADAGHRLLYDPGARFVHAGGASVPRLGYGPFQWLYYRHLVRYLRRHHGGGWALLARAAVVKAMALRLLLLPLRRPGRAASRGDAARALLGVIAGAVTGFRSPRRLAERFAVPGAPGVGEEGER